MVKIISETQQEFNGDVYWKCGEYYQRYGNRLHRVVWISAHGEIPKGYHVHHIDGNKSNNCAENLTLLSEKEHMSLHMHGREKMEFSQSCRDAAAVWHGSESGRAWHLQHYEKHKHLLHKEYPGRCEQCGKDYICGKSNSRFCSNNCKTKHRKASGIDNEKRTCPVCGNAFEVNKYVKAKTCSRACWIKMRWGNR